MDIISSTKMSISKRGFTLIELLVVISIIGLLSTAAMIGLRGFTAEARDTRRVADLQQMKKAIELYYDAHGEYPGVQGIWYTNYGGNWGIRCCPDNTWNQSDPRIVQFLSDLSPYMPKMPKAISLSRAVYVHADGSCQVANAGTLIQYIKFEPQKYKLSTRLESDCESVRSDGGTSTCCPIINTSSKGRSYEVYEIFNPPDVATRNPTY